MDQQVATEAASEPEQKAQPSLAPLEIWASNERMRHIPPVAWIIDKLDGDVRRRIEALAEPFYSLPATDPRHASIEESFAAIVRAVDRLADVARHTRGAAHPPAQLSDRILWSMGNAVAALRTIDGNAFGRRFPFHTGDRSKAECVYASFLAVIQQVQRAMPLVRSIDENLDERLLHGLVNLQEPLRSEPMA